MSEDEAPGDLSKLTVDPNPDLFMQWNFDRCRTLENMTLLNHYGVQRIAQTIAFSINLSEKAIRIDPNRPVDCTILIEMIDNYPILVWPQKSFFINEIVLPYQDNHIARIDYMQDSIEKGLLSSGNSNILKLLKHKLYTKTPKP